MAYDNLIVIDRGASRIITLNRPDVRNALNKATFLELEKAIDDVAKAKDIRALIITGAGEKSFVAGADILEMSKLSPPGAEAFSQLSDGIFNKLEKLPVPTIAAVNGYALGGGLELALACDFIYAAESAELGLVETNLGLIPGFGGIARLTRRVGVAWAREMVFTAHRLKAPEASRIGLVNRVFPLEELIDQTVRTAERIGEKGPYAVALAKRLLLEGQDADQRTAIAHEQRAFGLIFGTEDMREGVTAFLEKRKPTYTGQ